MTPDPSEGTFVSEWPELERRLRRTLSRKSVDPWLQDDIVQETGLRLLRVWDDVDPKRGPWPLAVTIANNLLWDERNRRQRRELLGGVPEVADGHNVEHAGLARLELGHVKRALTRMNHNYRSVLLAEVGLSIPLEGNPRALNMLRMRARRSLTRALGYSRDALGAIPFGWRKLNAWLSQFSSDLQPVIPSAAALVTAASVGLIALFPSDNEIRAKPQEPRQRVTTVAPTREAVADSPIRRLRVSKLPGNSESPTSRSQAKSGDSPPEETSVEAGPVKARSGERDGYRYGEVRTGDGTSNEADDHGGCVSVAVANEEAGNEEDPCQ